MSQDYYLLFLTDLIKKQMVMLGPNLVLSKAKKVSGLEVTSDGKVTAIKGDPQKSLAELSGYFKELSGHITQATLDRLFEKYPAIKKQSVEI